MNPEPGTCWKHFKGTNYIVLHQAYNSEDASPVVIYTKLGKPGSQVWSRPLKEWNSHIERDGYSGPRFAPWPQQ